MIQKKRKEKNLIYNTNILLLKFYNTLCSSFLRFIQNY